MALKKDQNYLPHIKRNAGIGRPDQIEFVARTTAPTDSDLANGRLYYDSTDEVLYARANGAWEGLLNSKLKVTNLTSTTTITSAQSGLVLLNPGGDSMRITLPSASSNNGLQFKFVKKNADASIINITAASGDEIDVAGTSTLSDMNAQGDTLTLVSDGGGTWRIVGRYIH